MQSVQNSKIKIKITDSLKLVAFKCFVSLKINVFYFHGYSRNIMCFFQCPTSWKHLPFPKNTIPIDIQEQFTKPRPRVSFLKWRQLVEFEAARKSVNWTSLKMYDLCPKSMCGSCLCFCSNFVWCSFQLSLLPSSWARNLFTFRWKQ